MDERLPTMWVCPHCYQWSEDRRQLRDVSCIVNAQEFDRYEIVFSREDTNRIVEIRLLER